MVEYSRRGPSSSSTSRAITPPMQPVILHQRVSPKMPPRILPIKPVEKPVVIPKPPQQIVLDKFGCFRLAVAPEMEPARNRSLSRGRNSPYRRSRSPSFRRRRSRSGSFRGNRRRRSPSPYSRNSPSRRRFDRHGRRRTPSPFDIRRVPRHNERSRTPDRRISRSRSPRGFRGGRGFHRSPPPRHRSPVSKQRSPPPANKEVI